MNRDALRRPAQAVLFDLDGTLLDTAPDMIGALNRLREECGRPPIPEADLRSSVSHGSARLVRLGFPDLAETELQPLQDRVLVIYRANLSHMTRLFPGMETNLDEMRSMGLKLGIVTNKPGWLTQPLLEELHLDACFDCVVSGDTLPERKPHPMPMLHAAALAGTEPPRCVYVGDAERDIQAARAANMTSLIALYGYIGEQERTLEWRADGDLDAPQALLPWLRKHGHV